MPETVADRLRALGIELPAPAPAAANYIPVRRSGNLVVVSGQLPMEAGSLRYQGKLGGGVSLEDGQAAARLCAINILAQVNAACGGSLDRVQACLRLGGFVACTPDFADHPMVIYGAADLRVAVLGEAGRHARAAGG
ncbi:MAG: RidA family protein, partial [Geminicoccaceae bacterium]